MREIAAAEIVSAIRELCVGANRVLPEDLEKTIRTRAQEEQDETASSILCDLCRNLDAAREMQIPICQDTGMAVVFAEVGQEVHIQGDFEEAVNEGVRQGYVQGLLRCSVVKDPPSPGEHRGQHPGHPPHPPCSRGQADPHRGTQGLWQREYEPPADVHSRG